MNSANQTIQQILQFCQFVIASLWIYQGLIPKIIYKVIVEQQFWQFTGVQFLSIPRLIELSGVIEIVFGLSFLIFRQSNNIHYLHYLNILGMLFFLLVVAVIYPLYFVQAFNPLVMNLAMIGLSVVAIQLMPKKYNDWI